MKAIAALWALSTAMIFGGCATNFQDTAQADADHVYVVGSRQVLFLGMQPKVWRCPEASQGECVMVYHCKASGQNLDCTKIDSE